MIINGFIFDGMIIIVLMYQWCFFKVHVLR